MAADSRTMQMLHEDHEAKLQFTRAIERLLDTYSKDQAPPTDDSLLATVRSDIRSHFGRLPDPHFEFEETVLFPLMSADGGDDLSDLLCSEHRTIEAAARKLLEAAAASEATGFDVTGWAEFRNCARDVAVLICDHIDKEEAAFPDLLAEILDPEDDQKIAMEYAAKR